MRSATDRFGLVDALRAVAALMVFGTHAAIFAGFTDPGSDVGRYAQRLEVGVAVFFLISGFVLYRPFVLRRVAGRPEAPVRTYAWRRLLRVAPAYWVALTVSAAWLGTAGVLELDGLAYYAYGQTYREATIGGGLTQAWTLCVEVAFYAFLPAWALAMRRVRTFRHEALALGGLLVVSVGWKVAVLAAGSAEQVRLTPLLLALPAYLDHFALGMGLAVLTVWLRDRPSPPRWLGRFDRAATASWGVALVAFWAVSTQIGIGDAFLEPMTPGQYLARHALYAVVALGLLAPAVLGTPGRGLARRVLGTRVLAWVGLVSYGLYLWHLTGLALLDRYGLGNLPGPRWLVWPVAGLAVGLLLAAASYHLVERPAQRLRDLGTWRRPRAAPRPATTDAGS